MLRFRMKLVAALQRDNQQPATERPAWDTARELCPFPLHHFCLAQGLRSPRSLPWDTQTPSPEVPNAPTVTDVAQMEEGGKAQVKSSQGGGGGTSHN